MIHCAGQDERRVGCFLLNDSANGQDPLIDSERWYCTLEQLDHLLGKTVRTSAMCIQKRNLRDRFVPGCVDSDGALGDQHTVKCGGAAINASVSAPCSAYVSTPCPPYCPL